ncbi:RIP metalloprotease RseP [Litoreibacter arenae]|uniref:Zinc metalloprotease n=1 Tax=Litoreibacter arenae DSM 19593 TaxID=1123360 RepID=S9QGP6_9RHOB|nr:RIP metalloprotease RseP [Litoreibacter arenae]EPX79027.1 Membrane-associated zinc metalloprotease [Litoreibacter arenae DSM 19593]
MDILGMLPSFGGFFGSVLAFIVALSVIVAIHEYGHYIVGRWCGIHAEVFSLGFGPVLYSRVDKRGTRWQVAALPFGGYVKFLGDSDAASGKDGEAISSLSDAERKRTMHGADLWRRAATVAAGPVFNFILSIFVFAGIFLFSGTTTDDAVIGKLKPLPGPVDMFEPGDRLLKVGDAEIASLEDFYTAARDAEPSPTVTYEVERDGQVTSFDSVFPFPPVIDQLQPKSAAMDGGLEVGDVIQSVNGTPVYALSEVQAAAAEGQDNPMELLVWRNGEVLEKTLTPRQRDLPTADGFESRWLIGFSGGAFFEPPRITLGAGDAFWGGIQQTWFIAQSSLSGMWHMVTGAISSCNIQGPIGIAQTSGDMASQGVAEFIWFIAVLSTAVGLLNLFPIPVLDGGHLVFYAYEAVVGRPPSDKALNAMMMTGLFLLLSLMVFALSNDFFCS